MLACLLACLLAGLLASACATEGMYSVATEDVSSATTEDRSGLVTEDTVYIYIYIYIYLYIRSHFGSSLARVVAPDSVCTSERSFGFYCLLSSPSQCHQNR